MNINFEEILKNPNLKASEFLEIIAKMELLQHLNSKSIDEAVEE